MVLEPSLPQCILIVERRYFRIHIKVLYDRYQC